MNKFLLSLFTGLVCCVTTAMADVTFTVNVPAGTKQCYVVGGLPQLSSWSAGAAVPMTRVGEKDQFTVTVVGIGYIHGFVRAIGDFHALDTIICDPVIDAGACLLHVL